MPDSAPATTPTALSPKQFGEEWGLSVDGVLRLIAAGAIRAVDISLPGSRKPRWKITPEAVADFIAARSTHPPQTKKPRRQRGTLTYRYYD